MVLAGCFSKLSRPMPPIAYFGIESRGLNLAIDLLIVFVVVLYVALIYWTFADARRRIDDPMLIGCAIMASLFPFVGTIIYMIVRPPEYLEDVRERELETRAAEARLRQVEQELCPHCSYRVERDFIRCPSCLRKLKERCANCSRPLDQTWTICPYCEADVPGIAPGRSRRRRGATVLEANLSDLALSPASSPKGEGNAAPVADELSDGAPVEPALAGEPSAGADAALATEPSPAARRAGARAARPPGRRPTS